jgi:(E)-4-hydroxy-3-methylbut-2-enyl-diphosphate synthase
MASGIRRTTRKIKVGSTFIGGDAPIAVQSMCATKTTDLEATRAQIALLEKAGADLIRIAIDSRGDIDALKILSSETDANLVVDLQENYRLAEKAAPYISKFRYNPGHLHHHQKDVSVQDKVKYLAQVAGENSLAVRVGVNFGSLDPELKESSDSSADAAISSAMAHCEMLEKEGFKNYVVSLKSSHPLAVVEINKLFSEKCPDVPLHLGVTEAGMMPDGMIKTRIAFEQLLAQGIGETLRVSLTLPDEEKNVEVEVAREIIADVAAGRFRSVPEFLDQGLNVISCPSCSRVENKAFVKLAHEVKDALEYAKDHKITVAVMGCRVNGPGETDDADLGLWCAPTFVNLKRGPELVGKFSYEEVVARLRQEVDTIIASNAHV